MYEWRKLLRVTYVRLVARCFRCTAYYINAGWREISRFHLRRLPVSHP